MDKNTLSRRDLESLLVEHNEITNKIKEIIDWWSQLEEKGIPKYGEMGMHIHELKEILATHYAEEEQKGCFDFIRSEIPEIDFDDHDFEKEHSGLLLKLDELVSKLILPEPAFHSWQEAMDRFEEFLKPFDEHEQTETRIIREALKNKAVPSE